MPPMIQDKCCFLGSELGLSISGVCKQGDELDQFVTSSTRLVTIFDYYILKTSFGRLNVELLV